MVLSKFVHSVDIVVLLLTEAVLLFRNLWIRMYAIIKGQLETHFISV